MPEHIPRYRDSLLRIELGHPVLVRGNRRGTVDGFHLTDENAIRVKVVTEESGWLTCTVGELEYHEVPDEVRTVTLPANIVRRFQEDHETDADVLALVNAYRLALGCEADPMYAGNGVRR
jgi:hypothetical protein